MSKQKKEINKELVKWSELAYKAIVRENYDKFHNIYKTKLL